MRVAQFPNLLQAYGQVMLVLYVSLSIVFIDKSLPAELALVLLHPDVLGLDVSCGVVAVAGLVSAGQTYPSIRGGMVHQPLGNEIS